SVTLDNNVALSDSNTGAQITSATVAIDPATFLTGDTLAVDTTGFAAITASYDSTAGILTLTGADTPDDYRQVPAKVTFTTPSDNPTNFGSDQTRIVTWVVKDDSPTSSVSNTATSTISLTAVNDAPSVTAALSVSFSEGAGATAVSPALSVSDVDSLNITGATVAITGGTFAGDGDVLTFSTTGTSITA